MLDAFETTYTILVAFYITARLYIGLYYLVLAKVIPMVRAMMISHGILTFIPAVLWIISIHIETPQRYAMIWVAIFIELWGATILLVLIRRASVFSPSFGNWIDQKFEFYPAVNIEHKVERTNAFVTLVFGYSVVAIIYQNAAPIGLNAFFGKAVLGLIQAFCFNWIYFELDGSDLYTHAIRRNGTSGMLLGSC